MAGSSFDPRIPTGRQRRWRVLVAVAAALLATFGFAGVAAAAPGDENPDGDPPMSTVEKLEAIAKAYYDSQAALEASLQRQTEIRKSLAEAEAALDEAAQRIGRVAAARYKGGTVGLFNGLINSEASVSDLLDGAAVSEYLLWRDDSYIRQYRQIKEEAERQQALLEEEIAIETSQRDALDQQKFEAERALALEGGMIQTTGFNDPAGPVQPVPRNPDGSYPPDSCTYPDPTPASGCLTFRTWHMLNEARAAGFGLYVSCFRSGTWGEHPKGRACDFSVFPGGFQARSAGTGTEARDYGNRLASWAVANATDLGVLYVIWYRQVWTPKAGWHSYSGAAGDPASDHTNHVHISMR